MRHLHLVLIAMTLFWSAPALAELSTATVRDGLEAENFDELESAFQAAYQGALDSKDFETLRDVYSTLFNTAHDARLAKTRKWLAAYSDSPFAATALAWSHYYRAYQIRGIRPWDWTSEELRNAFFKDLDMSFEMTKRAMHLAPEFVPAIDAIILLSGTNRYHDDLIPHINQSLRVASSRHAVHLAQSALKSRTRKDAKSFRNLCAWLSIRVPDYDAELCLIEIVFRNHLKGALRERAVQALDGRDEPFLDYARLDAYLDEWRNREEARDEAVRLHRETLGPKTSIFVYLETTDRIERVFNHPLYEIEAKAALIDEMQERLADNPQSHNILALLMRDIMERHQRGDPNADLQLAQTYWRDMLKLSAYRPETWEIGFDLHLAATAGKPDPVYSMKYRANQIYYSGYWPGYLRDTMTWLHALYGVARGEVNAGNLFPDKAALLEQVECPMFRAARVYRLVCDAVPDHIQCNVGGYNSDLADRLFRQLRDSKACTWVRAAEPEMLFYSPVPADDFVEGY